MIDKESCKRRVYVNQSVIRATPKTKLSLALSLGVESATSHKLVGEDHVFYAVTIRGDSYQGKENKHSLIANNNNNNNNNNNKSGPLRKIGRLQAQSPER